MRLTQRFSDALAFADHRHRGHVRKGTGIPYISHLLAVAGIVLEFGGNEDEAIAALLHDAVEDKKATAEEIRRTFGESVASIVKECSDRTRIRSRPGGPQGEIHRTPRQCIGLSAAGVVADKLHNARAILADYCQIGDRLWDRFNKDADTLWHYRALVDAFRKTQGAGCADR